MSLKMLDLGSGAAGGLELEQIQGDVLVGLQKKSEAFLLFQISDVPAFKSSLRAMIDRIIFCDAAAAREEALRAAKESGDVGPALVASNILFSKAGIDKLVGPGGAAMGEAFGRSGPEREALLLDPAAARHGGFDREPDGVLLTTGIDDQSAVAEADGWRAAFGSAIMETHFEIGRVRPGKQKGHEHFGFMDGVSQPGIEGLTAPGQHAPGAPPGDPDQGLPGQDLIKPGAFVLGYPNQDGTLADPPRPWMRNGSFMVLRRLEQQVRRFDSFLLAAGSASGGADAAEKLGAQLVGRWRSGAPVIVSPSADDPALAADQFRNNDFDFQADDNQAKCPFAGHIRKSYPRDDLDFTTPFPAKGDGEAFAETHRILRAGIPFGFEIDQDPDFGAGERAGSEASRGLMFVSYQSSIEAGFEFIQTQWCNEPAFPIEKHAFAGGPVIDPGMDLIIGQTAAGPRSIDLSSDDVTRIVGDVPPFVVPTGTAYFFSPSRSALENELTRSPA